MSRITSDFRYACLFLFLLLLLPPVLLSLPGCGQKTELIDLAELGPDEVAVAALSPTSRQLRTTQPLIVVFSQALTGRGYEPGGYLDEPPAHITPEIAGYWKWAQPHKLQFTPDDRYLPNTEYRVVLDADIAEPAALHWRGPRAFVFTAEPFRVVRHHLFRQRSPGAERAYVVKGTVSFNYAVDPEAFQDAYKVELDRRGPVDFELETTTPNRHLSFTTATIAPDERDEELSAAVAAKLRPTAGGASLDEEAVEKLRIPAIQRLAINRVEPDQRQERPLVRIDFSDQVFPADLEAALSVTPAVPNLAISSEGRRVFLSGDWQFGVRYKLTIAAELVSASGLVLERRYEGSIHIEDLKPTLAIAGTGNYLALRGDRTLAVETLNVGKFTVELDRVFANNIVHFLHEGGLRRGQHYYRNRRHYGQDALPQHGTNLYRHDLAVAAPARNSTVVTPISLDEALATSSRGIFRLTIHKEDQWELQDTKLVVATDLGLVTKRSDAELLVAAASIQDLTPLADVTIEVYSYNNQVLATARTDSDGIVSFTNLASDSRGDEPFVVVATRGGDLGFLSFDDTRIDTGDLDVGGIDSPSSGYRAYPYSDRGIYRPGDTAHLAWIVRDHDLHPPEEFPLTLLVHDPTGAEFTRARVTSGPAGTGEFTLVIPDWARTGNYRVALQLDEETTIGRLNLRVEDFMPERMKVILELLVDDEAVPLARPDQMVTARVMATSLFGPPAADRQASAHVKYFHEPIRLKDWRGFTFGDPEPERTFPDQRLGTRQTDADGIATWDVPLPATEDYHGWLRAQIRGEVTELGGGRSITVSGNVVISPVTSVIGLRRVEAATEVSADGGRPGSDYARPGEPLPFEAVLLDLDGQPQTAPATLTVYRKTWRTVLRKDPSGRYRYVSEYDEQTIEERPLALSADVNDLTVTVDSHGSYRLVMASEDGAARGSLDFYVYGWGYSPWAMSHPERVNLKLDRELYRAGQELSVSIEAPFAGLLLLCVEREHVFHHQWLQLEANTASVDIRLPDGLEPNAYLTATLLRPLDALEIHAPTRAFGAVPIFLDRTPATLPVEIEVPETTRPHQPLTVRFRLPDLPAGETAPVTVAVVDEGILQVTDFATPSPLDFFLQRRRLSLQTHDIWSLLLPEYERILSQSSAGGGADHPIADMLMPPGLASRLNPLAVKRVQPLALWSGIMDGASEWRTVDFDLPRFNGAVRVMVVAAAGERFGSGAELMRVRDPIVLSPNLPRFLAPGDEISVPIQVYNGVTTDSGAALPIKIALQLDGPVELREGKREITINVLGGSEAVARFAVRATDEIGKAVFSFTAEGGGEQVSVSEEMSVRPPWPLETVARTGVVGQDDEAEVELTDRWYPGTGHVTVTVSPLPIAQFGTALPYLLGYPYGCVEQKTSRCFPLLYFAELARELAPEAFGEHDADYFVNSGIDYLAAMSLPDGGFSSWPGGGSTHPNPWGSVYATHFLVEASHHGYLVPEYVLTGALRHLSVLARGRYPRWRDRWPERAQLHTRSYATYVLALADQPERGAMDYLSQQALADLTTTARVQLAGAYGLLGNLEMLRQLLPAQPTPPPDRRDCGYTWYSRARDEAIQLDVLATVAPDHEHVPVLLARLAERARNGRWHNTQENGFALVALGKLIAAGVATPGSGEILVDGAVVATYGGIDGVVIRGRDWPGQRVEIRATGPGAAYYSVLDAGVPRRGGETDVAEGLHVTRTYYDETGERLELDRIEQGQIIVCRLALSSEKGRIENVVIADLVPAGLEIENPRLVNRGGLPWIDELDRRKRKPLTRDHLEVRDDRLLLFTTATRDQRVFFYGLRAVTAGEFVLPPVKAEAMYDPDVRSVRGSGEVVIEAR